MRSILVLLLLTVLPAKNLFAQKGAAPVRIPPTRILVIFDVSNSMKAEHEGKTRMETAKVLFSRLLDSLQRIPNLELALRMYGYQKAYPPGDCNDTRLVVPFAKGNTAKMKELVKPLKPTGITP